MGRYGIVRMRSGLKREMKMNEQTKKSLQGIDYKARQCLQKQDFTPDDMEDLLIFFQGLLQDADTVRVFLKWLGRMAQIPEVKRNAHGYGWALDLFSKFVAK